MTVVVALQTKTLVFMGADSLASRSSLECSVRRDSKVSRVGPFVIGYTTSFRMGQLLRFGSGSISLADLVPGRDALKFMVSEFVPKVRRILKAAGFMRVKEEKEEAGEFIVAWGNQLFQVYSDLQVASFDDPYAACGCGAEVALGSLYSTEGDPEGRLRLAMQAAERHSSGVRRPFHVLKTRGK